MNVWQHAFVHAHLLLRTVKYSRMGMHRTCGVDGALGNLLHILEELRLGHAGVSQQQHVDVPTQPVRAGGVLGLATKERQRNAHLNVVVAIDGGRYALADALAYI